MEIYFLWHSKLSLRQWDQVCYRCWETLKLHPTKLFPRGSVIPAFRRSKNLKELLAPSRLKTAAEGRTDHHNNGCFKCNRNRCDLCKNFVVESKSFLSFKTEKKYTIHSSLSCDSKNVIYLASCKKCRLQYVGSTTTDFRIRFRNHKSAMLTNKTTCEVAVHFNKIPHTLDDFSFQCIDHGCRPHATLKKSIGF